MFKNVVIGLKDGNENQPLLELATKAAPPPARLHLISLLRVGTQADEPRRLEELGRSMEGQAEPLRQQGYTVSVHVGLVVVAAATDLVRAAADRDADLLVIGLAKRSRVGKALLGSDAQRVLLAAPCPVLGTHVYSL